MWIIIEGLDRTGKSTLVSKLAETLPQFEVVHVGKPKTDDVFKEYLDLADEYDGEDVIFDRFYPGEYVYANLYRGGCNIADFQFNVLDLLASSNQTIMIYASAPSNDELVQRCKNTGEPLADFNYLQDVKKAQRLYSNFFKLKSIIKGVIDYISTDSGATDELVSRLSMTIKNDKLHLDRLKKKKEKLEVILASVNARSIGSLDAPVVLVGERLRPGAALDEPPFSSGSAASYLFKTIRDSVIIQRGLGIYITNAIKMDHEIHDLQALADEVSLLQPRCVVPLGSVATKYLRRLHCAPIPVSKTVPHPSYWKRFHYNDAATYTRMLDNAVFEGRKTYESI